jgi:hypothetical protein
MKEVGLFFMKDELVLHAASRLGCDANIIITRPMMQ